MREIFHILAKIHVALGFQPIKLDFHVTEPELINIIPGIIRMLDKAGIKLEQLSGKELLEPSLWTSNIKNSSGANYFNGEFYIILEKTAGILIVN